MNNEIKLGDKVRVSKDIPQFYLEYNSYRMFEIEHRVVDVNMEDGFALLDSIPPKFTTILPTKYLVKVDAEAKEPKYRKGDRIKFKNIYELQKVKDKSFRWMLVMFASKEATITAVEDNGFYRVDIDPSIGGINDDMIECKVEPTEQTEANIKTDEIDFSGADTPESIEGRIRRAAERTKTKGDTLTFPIAFDLSDSYWDAYAADLAKEVALKVANKYNDPEQAAEYAVSVAKAVVEGLKRK